MNNIHAEETNISLISFFSLRFSFFHSFYDFSLYGID